jgi:2-keto-4-pentenoate hydratase/2-oxohepta-3-ene-1,7-dioic acid hydratase in catechol pathway
MRFASYRGPTGARHSAIVDGDLLVDLPAGLMVEGALGTGLDGLLEVGSRALRVRHAVRDLAGSELLAPLVPRSLRDFMTFEQHIDGTLKNRGSHAVVDPLWYAAPAFYFSNPAAVVGPYADVPIPPGSEAFDFELEVATVLGKGGRDLDLDAARDAIVGYTILNDWSARDLQLAEMQMGLGPAKGKDSASTLGPFLVTADELTPHDVDGFLDLGMTARVADRVMGTDRVSQMAWSFAELVVYASRGAPVAPGDVIGSGTCGGGCLAELRGRRSPDQYPWLVPGDVVTLTVDVLGEVANRVVASTSIIHRVPPARRRTWPVDGKRAAPADSTSAGGAAGSRLPPVPG